MIVGGGVRPEDPPCHSWITPTPEPSWRRHPHPGGRPRLPGSPDHLPAALPAVLLSSATSPEPSIPRPDPERDPADARDSRRLDPLGSSGNPGENTDAA